MKKIYVSGKIENELKKFEKIEKRITTDGNICMSAIKVRSIKGFNEWDYMRVGYTWIDICDAVYFLNNWHDSEVSILEHFYAELKAKPILYDWSYENEYGRSNSQ